MPERTKETKWSWLLVVGAKSLSENQFVAGDDFGKLKLYNYPVIKPKVLLLNIFHTVILEYFSLKE